MFSSSSLARPLLLGFPLHVELLSKGQKSRASRASRASRVDTRVDYRVGDRVEGSKTEGQSSHPSISNHGGGKGSAQPPPRPVVRDDHRALGRMPVRPHPLRGEPNAAGHGDPVRRLPLVPGPARGAGRREGRDARRRGEERRRRRRRPRPLGGPEEGGRDALPDHRIVQPVRAVPRVQVLRQGDREPGDQLLLLRHGVVRDHGRARSGPRGRGSGGAPEEDRVAHECEPPAPGVGGGEVAVEDRDRLQPRRPAGVRGRSGVLRAVLLHEEVVPKQRPRDMLLPQGYRAVQPWILQDRRHPAGRAVLLRHREYLLPFIARVPVPPNLTRKAVSNDRGKRATHESSGYSARR